MDALILSCGTGGGHDAAAKALEEELLRRGHSVRRINPFVLKSERRARVIDQSYIRLVQRSPKAFGVVYRLGDMYRNLPVHSPVYALNGKMVPQLRRYLTEHPADVVLMTHLFPGDILTHMRHQGIPIPKTVMVATDYTCVPLIEEVEADAYVIPAADLAFDFTRRGIPSDKIHPCGIPVSAAFSAPCDRQAARARLGLDSDRRYLLIAGGSMGAGKMTEVLRTLDEAYHEDPQMRYVVICGRNQRVYDKLRAQYGDRALILMHTNQMADYLHACDLYLTKPGGLSTTEAAVAGIPLIHITPIPGCETCNAAYFSERGMSRFVQSPRKELIPAIRALEEPENLAAMQRAQARWINPGAASDICDLAERLVSR